MRVRPIKASVCHQSKNVTIEITFVDGELVVKEGVHTKLNIEENIEEAIKRRVYVDDLLEELTVEELMEANPSKL